MVNKRIGTGCSAIIDSSNWGRWNDEHSTWSRSREVGTTHGWFIFRRTSWRSISRFGNDRRCARTFHGSNTRQFSGTWQRKTRKFWWNYPFDRKLCSRFINASMVALSISRHIFTGQHRIEDGSSWFIRFAVSWFFFVFDNRVRSALILKGNTKALYKMLLSMDKLCIRSMIWAKFVYFDSFSLEFENVFFFISRIMKLKRIVKEVKKKSLFISIESLYKRLNPRTFSIFRMWSWESSFRFDEWKRHQRVIHSMFCSSSL